MLSPAHQASTATGASPFVARHIGPSEAEREEMLQALGMATLDELMQAAIPPAIRTSRPLDLPPGVGEQQAQAELADLAASNRVLTSLVGLGFHASYTPAVIRRDVLENPSWYTAYTPYQAEISQGRLEALLNFQTMVSELTGMDLANASLLDEGSAAAEAMLLCHRVAKRGDRFLVDADCHPHVADVVRTRAAPLGIEVGAWVPGEEIDGEGVFGVLVQYPGSSGEIPDMVAAADAAAAAGAKLVVSADPLALTLLRPPGEVGADVVVGTTQRFGVPLWFGGPHAAYMAVKEEYARQLPGRLVGVSVDAEGRPALRLALQTREQHIRRQRATSNICTAQVLLAVVAGCYGVWHGPDGLSAIAGRVHRLTATLATGLAKLGYSVRTKSFFDTITVEVPGRADEIADAAAAAGINLRQAGADRLGLSLDETTTAEVVERVWGAFGADGMSFSDVSSTASDTIGDEMARKGQFMGQEVFHRHRSETAMMRYLRSLAEKDFALDRGMIPLGSCTMKLNAAAELAPITWPGFAELHPFAPLDQAQGYLKLIGQLEQWLAEISGFEAVSMQPNAGSQGELAGLLAIRGYHLGRGEPDRDVCLIPSSAHGTNAASAALAGLSVEVVACDASGSVDLDDLNAKLRRHAGRVAALMVTYPSTHGVYEANVADLCRAVHEAGGQVYFDGANLNALVGFVRPGEIGADVAHFNLHKTFCIPHGGGGPGVGPIGVAAHLAPYLPTSSIVPEAGPAPGMGSVASAPWGSPGVLPISWAYVRMMGPDGLVAATASAVLAANYVAKRLDSYFPVLYTGNRGTVAHECILDLRPSTARSGVTAEDVAKRLMDYGFHAPTMSWPVPGTLMVEPTESEPKEELDRFCEAMISVAGEIEDASRTGVDNSPLRFAPHTGRAVTADQWDRPYSRTDAAFPAARGAGVKYWPPVARVDNAQGDRQLVCSCPPLESYLSSDSPA